MAAVLNSSRRIAPFVLEEALHTKSISKLLEEQGNESIHYSDHLLFLKDNAENYFNTFLLTTSLSVLFLGLLLKSNIPWDKKGRRHGATRNIPHIYSWFAPFYYLYRLRKDGIKLSDELAAKYGPVFKVHTPFLKLYVVSEHTIPQKILSSSSPHLLHKPKFINNMFSVFGIENGLLAIDNTEIWRKHKKILNPSFSYHSLCGYMKPMTKYTGLLIQELLTEIEREDGLKDYVGGQILDQILTLNNIKTIASVVLGSEVVTDEENLMFRRDFKITKEITMHRLYYPWLINDLVWRFHPQNKIFAESRARMFQYIWKIVNIFRKREEMYSSTKKEYSDMGLKQHRPMIVDLLESDLSEEEICHEILAFFIAGHESSSTQMKYIMFLLALNPEEMRKCQEEIDAVVSSLDTMEMEDLGKLKHLERCIYECLRILPVFPVVLRRLETTLRIDDSLELEAGSNVLVSMWSMHRNPKLFKDPMKFDPNRFIPEKCKERGMYAYLPFSAGPRNCIGWKLAMAELKVVMVAILGTFDIFTNQKLEEVKFVHNFSILPEKDIDLRLKKRTK